MSTRAKMPANTVITDRYASLTGTLATGSGRSEMQLK